jgi:CelD/BcsL family acetyltransferase involved in cellulose biosynthesis
VCSRVVICAWKQVSPEIVSFWDRAIAENQRLTPFHSREWLDRWATAYRQVDRCRVWVQYSNAGVVEALLPMMSTETEVRSLSDSCSDYTGSVTVNDDGVRLRQLAHALIETSRNRRTLLWNVSAADPLVKALDGDDHLRLVRRHIMHRVRLADAVYRDGVCPPRIAQMKTRAARLARMGGEVEVDVSPSAQDVEQMIFVHTARWNSAPRRGIFADARCAQLFRSLPDSGLPICMASLRLGSRLVAYRFGFRFSGVYYDWNLGFDPGFRHLSPGAVLLARQIDHYRAVGSPAIYDFLLGDEQYKRSWATDQTYVSEYEITQ